MYGIIPQQAQQAARGPRDAANQPRPEDIIDLVSDEEVFGSENTSDEDAEDMFFDPPQDALQALQAQAFGAVPPQQQAAGGAAAEPRLGVRHLLMNHPQAYEHWPGADPPAQRQAGAGAGAQLYRPDGMPLGPAPAVARRPTPPPALNQAWGDYILDDEFDAEQFAQAMEVEWRLEANPPVPRDAHHPLPRPATPAPAPAAAPNPTAQGFPSKSEPRDECIQLVAAVFPGICFDHVSELYDKIAKSSERLIAHLLDQMDKGILYPKAKDKAKDLKRKREVDEHEEAARKYGAPDRIIPAVVNGIRPYIRNVLGHEFPNTPMTFVDATLSQSGHRLFSAYQLLDEADRTYDPQTSGYIKIKTQRKAHMDFREETIDLALNDLNGDHEKAEILRELRAARRYKAKGDVKREAERVAALEEEENERKAQAEGLMKECGCCFGDYPINRMVHCDAAEMHWFCRGCALRNAENEVGQSKYELCCMSMEGCTARFTISERNQFLDEKTKIALERNEQEANLRLAGIENLASCPFCPFAAEYPPVEVDREFRCQAPDCEKVSCRLCKLESHIPKTCEENEKETGLSVRRRIEEAMSAALIRKCNKCGTPFIKEEGCNKMRCTLKGCGNVQCYVCSKSCDYDHFDDQHRGGKAGNCPLFESVEKRHDEEVSKAEKEALDQVRAEHPEYTEDDLKVKVSENVKKDDDLRKARDPRAARAHLLEGAFAGRIFHGVPPGMHDYRRHNMEQLYRMRRGRRGQPAVADPALPVPPNPDNLIPFGAVGPRPGVGVGDDYFADFNDMGIFNLAMPWGDDLFPPALPGELPAPAAGPAAPPDFDGLFGDLISRQPPPQAMNAQGAPPLAAFLPPVTDLERRRLMAFQERLSDRLRRREGQDADQLLRREERAEQNEVDEARRRALDRQQQRGANNGAQWELDGQRAAAAQPAAALQPVEPNAGPRNQMPGIAYRLPGDLEARRRRLRLEELDEMMNERRLDLRLPPAANHEAILRDLDERENAAAVPAKVGASKRPKTAGMDMRAQAMVAARNATEEALRKAIAAGIPVPEREYLRLGLPQPPALPQPAEALRQQQILDHEERRIQRSQMMARLRRDQENDEAHTARGLMMLRQDEETIVARNFIDNVNRDQNASAPRPRQEPINLLSSPEIPKKKAAAAKGLFDLVNEADDENDDDYSDDDWA